MNKEELTIQGWEITSSTPCMIQAWGKHIIYLRHISGRVICGYGVDEVAALNDAVMIIQKPLEKTHEISH